MNEATEKSRPARWHERLWRPRRWYEQIAFLVVFYCIAVVLVVIAVWVYTGDVVLESP